MKLQLEDRYATVEMSRVPRGGYCNARGPKPPAERILGYLAQNPDGAADDEIAEALGLPHRVIAGGICRALERQGQIARGGTPLARGE